MNRWCVQWAALMLRRWDRARYVHVDGSTYEGEFEAQKLVLSDGVTWSQLQLLADQLVSCMLCSGPIC